MGCLFIYNPMSGKGIINKYLKYIEEKLTERYGEVTTRPSTRPKELGEFAKEACGVYDVLFFAGGDGSFNEVLNGIALCENRPVLGYIPTGTVNDIAHSLAIPRHNIKKAVRKVIDGRECELDVMKINGEVYAEYEVSAGALTSCSYKAPRNEKVVFGKLAYAFEMLRHNMKLIDFPVEVISETDAISTNCELIMFINSRYVASMPVNKKAVLDDGEVELIIVKQVKRPKWYHKLAAFFNVLHFFAFGYKQSKNGNVFKRIKGSHFKIKTQENLEWNFDGEAGGIGEIELEVVPRHIRVLAPKKYKRTVDKK